jgi:hypothetical protein
MYGVAASCELQVHPLQSLSNLQQNRSLVDVRFGSKNHGQCKT